MANKHFVILGGGISGLSLAWYLRRRFKEAAITVYEKGAEPGGVMGSHENEFLFEKGPRTFKTKRCHELLELVRDLGLTNHLITYNPAGANRYLWLFDRLQPISLNPFRIFTSAITQQLYKVLLTEWRKPVFKGDETIWDFGSRRFGRKAADMLLDPTILGVYAGDMRKLSIKSCFPFMKHYEVTYGSVLRGMRFNLISKRRACPIPEIKKSDLFSFKEGSALLVNTLREKSAIEFLGEREAPPLNEIQADHVFVALPAKEARGVIPDAEAQTFFDELPLTTLISVNFGFKKDVLPVHGYGYLCPTSEGQEILGVLFDSEMFPQQNRHKHETRLTVMMGGFMHPEFADLPDEDLCAKALGALQTHIRLKEEPDAMAIHRYKEAIPAFAVGHDERVTQFESFVKERYPNITFVGNYLHGCSVNQSIRLSKEVAHNLPAE